MLHPALGGHARRELSGTFQNPPDGAMFAGEGRTGLGAQRPWRVKRLCSQRTPAGVVPAPQPLQVLGGGLFEQTSPVDRALCTHLNADPARLDGRAPAQHLLLRMS